MGMVLLLLGTSGGKLLPKSGVWMNYVKHLFGFLLLLVPLMLIDRIAPNYVVLGLAAIILLLAGSYCMTLFRSLTNDKLVIVGFVGTLSFLLMFSGAMCAYHAIFDSESETNNAQTNRLSFKAINSYQQLREAIDKAAASDKTVIVDLYANWCIACQEFEHKTFVKMAAQQAMSNRVLLRIDLSQATPETSHIMEKLGVLGLPTILLFDQQGQELTHSRITGYMDANKFAAHLNKSFK